MDISTKKILLITFTVLYLLIISMLIYKVVFESYSVIGLLVNGLLLTIGYGMTYLVLSHDINKFKRWEEQAKSFSNESIGIVSDISLSSTRENGRNTVILSATYQDHELTFSGLHPDYQFKYKIGSEIELLIHPDDPQQFVLKNLGE